jgi:hypothetical protein
MRQTTGSSGETGVATGRLTLFFVVIVVLPVTAVTAYGWQAVARSSQRQVRSELELARRSATAAFLARVERPNEAVTALANGPVLLEAMAAGNARRGCGRCSAARARRTCSWP